jgi:hypothetical protein
MQKLCLAVTIFGLLAMAGVAGEEAATYKPDDEGFIRNWLVVGPIALGEKAATHEEDSQKGFFDKEFWTGQKKAMPKNGDKVTVDGKELAWKAVAAEEFALNFVKIYDGQAATNSLVLGVAYVVADADMDGLKLKIGSDDSSMWTLNDKELKRVYAGRAVEKDQDTIEGVTLKKGVNVLRMAVINGDGEYGACARFTDKDDKPVTNLKISLTPPTQ